MEFLDRSLEISDMFGVYIYIYTYTYWKHIWDCLSFCDWIPTNELICHTFWTWKHNGLKPEDMWLWGKTEKHGCDKLWLIPLFCFVELKITEATEADLGIVRLVSSQSQQFDRWPDNQCLGMQSVGGFAWDQDQWLLVPKNYRMSVKPINLNMDWPFLSFLISAKASSFHFLVGGMEHFLIVHFIYRMSSFPLIFMCFRGVEVYHQPAIINHH